MFDLLHVHGSHPLSKQIISPHRFHYQRTPQGEYKLEIDANVSDGMNGFLCLYERNAYRRAIPSPVKGLESIDYNQVLNATYLNPQPHKHIPEPPEGVIMPAKILKPHDIKSFPVLWHEDNGGRRQQAKERPQVQGAISGPLLGEAAHRLLRNSLQVKSNNNAGLLDSPYHQNFSNNMINKPRPAGPSGYEGGFIPDPNHHYHAHQPPSRGMIHPSRPASSSHEFQGNRPDLRQERLPQEQFRDMRGGMLNLTINDGPRYRQQQQYGMMPRMPNAGFVQYPNQHVRNTAPPPWPPTNWIDKQMSGNMGDYHCQESAPPGGYDKQVRKVYQPRTRPPQNPPDYGYQR